MRDYHDYEKKFIGSSDIAALIVVAPTKEGLSSKIIEFGEDGNYRAYIVDGEAEIESHYELVFECKSWLKIYDDEELTFKESGSRFKIFRAGDFGCIIQKLDK